jgi:hypothetical protein
MATAGEGEMSAVQAQTYFQQALNQIHGATIADEERRALYRGLLELANTLTNVEQAVYALQATVRSGR